MMSKLMLGALVMATALMATVGCDGKKEDAKAKAPAAKAADKAGAVKAPADKAADKAKEPAKKADKEIVFDPNNPPPGYKNCHRNHCHKIGGGIASYIQVMNEMGATKMVGGQKMIEMPKAPADVAKAPADAEVTASGLATKVLKPGDGKTHPLPNSVVIVHYTGWTADGKAFDSSIPRGKPARVPLERMFPGWTEGLQYMSVGEERRLWIPQELAYQGRPGKPAGTLVFDVELIEIK